MGRWCQLHWQMQQGQTHIKHTVKCSHKAAWAKGRSRREKPRWPTWPWQGTPLHATTHIHCTRQAWYSGKHTQGLCRGNVYTFKHQLQVSRRAFVKCVRQTCIPLYRVDIYKVDTTRTQCHTSMHMCTSTRTFVCGWLYKMHRVLQQLLLFVTPTCISFLVTGIFWTRSRIVLSHSRGFCASSWRLHNIELHDVVPWCLDQEMRIVLSISAR